MKRKCNHKKNAFTLIELLVVVGIVALLLGIGIPYVANSTEQSKLESERAAAKIVSDAIERCRLVGPWSPVLDGSDEEAAVTHLVNEGFIRQ